MAQGKVTGPAIGLMVTAGIGIALQVLSVLARLLGMGLAASRMGEGSPMGALAAGPIIIIFGLCSIIVGLVIFMGAMKMKNLQSHSLAVTVSVLAMIPCISPCCLLGIPIGIWSLIVLMNPDVKAAFR